jgi:tRNA-dihydrouridine synthase B
MTQKFYLAPLRGVTDTIFRTAFERYFGKFDYLLTPFITTVKGREVAPKHLKDIAGSENDRARVIPQILGNNAEDLQLLAKHINLLGYPTVNWNLGCPHPVVAKKKRGSGLLPYPEIITAILDRLVPALEGRLSVKVRLGYSDTTELERLLPLLNDYPLSQVVIHPRTGKQAYHGTVDLERFAAAASLCKHPVVYNGDIVSLEGFSALRQQFPNIRHWMIGRGAVHHPYLLASLRRGESVETDQVILRSFHDDIYRENSRVLFGPAHLLGKMKEFWWYYSSNFKNGSDVLKSIQHCSAIDQYCRKVDAAFAGR